MILLPNDICDKIASLKSPSTLLIFLVGIYPQTATFLEVGLGYVRIDGMK